ncbi:MAG TPA: CoA transferase [Mycobacterium sp.]|nr:CoA transferase [Mycobacterium sp.]
MAVGGQRSGSPQDGAALAGLKVVEFAHVIAGPLAGTLLADLGADVVHVEPPGVGDTGRKMGPAKDGVHLWWKVAARNKRSLALDLRRPAGQQVARKLAEWADVVITNLRADTLTQWGIDWDALHELNRSLIYVQITGFGANTSMRNAPGFGKVGEARSGVVHLTGFPDGPPVHTGFSHADTVTALTAAYGILAAAYRKAHDPDFRGEWIDLALFEPLFRLVEWQVIVHDQLGVAPGRSGNRLAIAPAAVVNTYLSGDGEWITVTSATVRSVRNVAGLLGLAAEEFQTVEQQVARSDELDDALRGWIGQRSTDEALRAMADAEVVASRIFSMDDIAADPIYAEREDIISVPDDELGSVRMQAVVPKLHAHGGAVWRTGPPLGADNEAVCKNLLGMTDTDFDQLCAAGVLGHG